MTDYQTNFFGSSIDTGEVTAKAITLAKMADGTAGGVIVYNASGVATDLGAGSLNQVVTSQGAGAAPIWQTMGQMTLLGTTTLGAGATSVTVSGLTTTGYPWIVIECEIVSIAGAGAIAIRLNSDSGNNYSNNTRVINSTTTWSAQTTTPYSAVGNATVASGNNIFLECKISNSSSRMKVFNGLMTESVAGGLALLGGRWNNNATITAVTVIDLNSNNMSTGTTLKVYGIT